MDTKTRLRLARVVNALRWGAPECSTDAVLAILHSHGVSRIDFLNLDSYPGTWGYEGNWHPLIRHIRNTGGYRE